MKTYLQLLLILLTFSGNLILAQTVMFDDFNYDDIDDPEIGSFNNWNIIHGTNGPPSGANYDKNNLSFQTDPLDPNNSIMILQTTVNGSTKATTQCRIETNSYSYFEGTYAARVKFSDIPYTYGDANIQTFYTIVSYLLAGDGSKYSELDFEYMASDKWGISPNNQVMYLTTWNRYIADPWQAWKAYSTDVKSYANNWHTLVMSATDGTNVKFWIDGVYFGALSVTDNDGTSVYPRSNMQVAFANWIWNNQTGNSSDNRNAPFTVDWVLHVKDEEKTTQEVNAIVENYKNNNIDRVNLAGSSHTNILTSNSKSTNNNLVLFAYPNPSENGIFTLSKSVNQAVVYNTLMQEVLTVHQNNIIDLSSLKSGVYFIKSNNETIKVLKK